MNSKATITALGSNLDTYLGTNYSGSVPIMDTEYDYRTLESLDQDGSIPGVRIGLFEQPEDILARVEDGDAYDLRQSYLMQLFFRVARIQDYDTVVEFELLDIKDLIYDWTYDIDAGGVTSNELLTWEWDGINRVDRQERYSLLEINFGGYRQTRL